MILLSDKTANLDDETRAQLSKLVLPNTWAMERWIQYDGSTFALIAYGTDDDTPIGWACLTFEEFPNGVPVIGVYVDRDHRGAGLATKLVRMLLAAHRKKLEAIGEIVASLENWQKYTLLGAEVGCTVTEYG